MKIIAVMSMLIDHAGYILYLSGRLRGEGYMLLRSLGRISFVLFAFLLVNGMEKSSNPRRYFSRLVLFALISQLPYSLAFTPGNYAAVGGGLSVSLLPVSAPTALILCGIVLVYFCCVCRLRPECSLLALSAALLLPYLRVSAGGYVLLGNSLSIFFTLAVSMALCMSVSALLAALRTRSGILRALPVFFAAAAAALLIQPSADYGFYGLLLIAGLYAARSSRAAKCAFIVLWCILEYYVKLGSLQYALFAMLAILPVFLYSGERGRRMGLGFYLVYPVHLCIFSLIGFALSR